MSDSGDATVPVASSDEILQTIEFVIALGRHNEIITRPVNSTIGDLRADIEARLSVPTGQLKLLCVGKTLKDDSASLIQAGIRKGSKILLLGTNATAITNLGSQEASEGFFSGDEKVADEPLCKQKQHAKVLEKGLPEEAIPGIKGKQVPLPIECKAISGLLNSQGVKVRLTFKDELQQLWISSATTTQKVPINTITKIEGSPIEGKEEYSIVALHLGSGSDKYWLYYFPSQHVASLKIRILGVESLL